MKIRYILGRAATGKTDLIFHEIKYRLEQQDNQRLILLVPEQFTLQAESDLITKGNLEGIMQVEVLSFARLAYKVFNEVGGIKKTSLNELGKIMVLRKLFDEYSKELSVYKKGSRQEGFLSNFCSLVSEFKKNDITLELLSSKVNEIEDDTMLKRKLEDISLMFGKFNEYIEGKYSDEDDKFNYLIEKLDESSYFDDAEIWIDGFHTFTNQEYKILEKLFTKAKKVNIALTTDISSSANDKNVFSPTLDTIIKVSSIAEKNNIPETQTKLPRDDFQLDKALELKHLEKELNSYPYNKYNSEVKSIELFTGTNQYTEIENVAAQIISLVRDRDYRWKDVAVVSNTMEIYGPIVKRVFSEYDIPFFLDEKRNIMNNPIVKLLVSAIEIMARNFKYEDVFKFIKTGFSDLMKTEYEVLENYVLRFGIDGERWLKDFEYEDEALEDINKIREKFVAPFIVVKKKIKPNSSILDITKYMFEFLTDINIEEKLSYWIEIQRDRGNLEYVNENTQIWNIIMEVFDQLVEILGDTKVTLREYAKILEAGLSEYKLGIIPPTMDQVLIGNLERSRSHDIRALFVVGVNDGILPSKLDDSGLLLDDEKIVMKDIGIPLYSDNETRAREENFSIYLTLVKPSQYLWISYPLADMEGKSLRPSMLIDRIRKLFKNINIKSDVIKDRERQLHLISRPVATLKYLIENMRLDIDDTLIDTIWWDVYDWYYNNQYWRERLEHIIEALFYKNQQDYISEGHSKSLYELPFKSSISRLEDFVNCPFAHFINYGLKPKERKIHKINAPDLGTLFHNSIEEFSRELTLEKLDWHQLERQKSDEIVEKVLDKMIEEFQHGILYRTHRYKYLVNKLKRISKRALWTLTEHVKKGEFVPLEHELTFGENHDSTVPPIVIALPNGEEIKLEGRIDRVDILQGDEVSYVKIIDYKSGSKKFSLSDVYYGLQIQLVVYLDAVMSNKDRLTKNDIYPAGVFYFRIDDPMIKTDEDDYETIEKEIANKLKLDGIIIKDINIVKSMDKSIEDEGVSSILPASLKKDGEFTKYSSVFDKADLDNMISHVKELITEIATEIIKGKIKIEPCKIGNQISCEYCEYASVCQFDIAFEDNKYKSIKKLGDDEVLEKIRKQPGGEE